MHRFNIISALYVAIISTVYVAALPTNASTPAVYSCGGFAVNANEDGCRECASDLNANNDNCIVDRSIHYPPQMCHKNGCRVYGTLPDGVNHAQSPWYVLFSTIAEDI